MRVGIVILPQHDWPHAARYWRGAEEYGFDHAWTYDHLAWRGLAGERWHATVPTLTAAAMVTERIKLGTFVASPNFRHPVPFAKDIATVDQISGGRMILGIGSGGTGFDAFVLGQPEYTPRQRFDRFVEFTEALDVLLRFERPDSEGVSYNGEWFKALDARMVGLPEQLPRMPFLVAADGPRGLRFAAEMGQGWVTTGGGGDDSRAWWAKVTVLSHRLDDLCAGMDRDPSTLDRSVLLDGSHGYALESIGAYDDAVGRASELGFTDVMVHWPRESGIYAAPESILDDVADRISAVR